MPKIMVSIDDESMTDMPRLVADLRRAGLMVDEVFEALGTVTGSIAPEAIDALRAVPGVSAVEWQHDNYRPADS
ncbi:hypothetical protein KIPE111705_45215 [Kibdelosporangium persicum]|uniref:Uncharacterized protein n=1 Tax=Kibdelosporangium persicum TaxID=2698649 RepID=A0ABX2FEP2_9PSEU|nr:hypothetical protein [Kibdelosporangium persicum]NRN69350.1 hypothetical protein [Kibdelosporangium persicum]